MNEIEPTEAQPANKRWPYSWGRAEWVPLGLLVFGIGISQFYFAMVEDIPSKQFTKDFISTTLLGIVLSQPVLFAIWGAWSDFSLAWRLPLFLCSHQLMNLAVFQSTKDSNFVDVNESLLGCGLGLWFVYSLFRFAIYFRIERQDTQTTTRKIFQFSIRYMLFLTTIISIILMAGQVVGFPMSFNFQDNVIFVTMLVITTTIATPCSILGVATFLLPMTTWNWYEKLAFFLFLAVLIIPIGTGILNSRRSTSSALISADIPYVFMGSSIYFFLAGHLFRWAGYRITDTPER